LGFVCLFCLVWFVFCVFVFVLCCFFGLVFLLVFGQSGGCISGFFIGCTSI
jgi:hypothetical protein